MADRGRLFRFLNRCKKWGIGFVIFVLLLIVLNLLFPLRVSITYSTLIQDEKGALLHAYLSPDQKWRMYTELNEIAPLLKKTIIEKEDQYFYYHPGVNPAAMARAFFKNLLTGRRSSGASTITMQVARALEPKSRTYWHKAVEVFRAFQLEWNYSKDEILQMYVNLVPYGGNIEGMKAASWIYFNKNPDHLSLAEITALSIIPNRPSSLVIGKNNDRIVAERNKWLVRFKESGLFSEKEIKDALDEPLLASRNIGPKFVPHLAAELRKSSNPNVVATTQLEMQLQAEKIVADYVRGKQLQGIHQAAVVVIENETRKVLVYVGSANFKDTIDAGQVNGVRAIREPGSTLKPFLYGMAFDEGLVTPKTVVSDVPVSYSGYAPENYDKQFNGKVSIEYALEHSLNIPAVNMLNKIGTEAFIDKLSEGGLKQIQKDRKKLGLSLVLGGCGASLLELTSLYSALPNNGLFLPPILTREDSLKQAKPIRVLSEPACYMLHETLSKVNRPDFPLNWQSTEHMPKIAWKTGTSYGRRDAWSIGYNRKYTIGVWLGNFNGTGVAGLSGANTATPLLFQLFNTFSYDEDEAWFNMPKSCAWRQVCGESGLLPEPSCEHLVTDYFIPLISSQEHCKSKEEIMVSIDNRISYCKTCAPASGYVSKLFPVLAPELKQYYLDHHVAFAQIPPHNPNCERVFKSNAPRITSPQNGHEYIINTKRKEPLQLSCQVANDVARVYWYVNDRFYKEAAPGSKLYFVPDPGKNKVSCTDDKGRNVNCTIDVSYVSL